MNMALTRGVPWTLPHVETLFYKNAALSSGVLPGVTALPNLHAFPDLGALGQEAWDSLLLRIGKGGKKGKKGAAAGEADAEAGGEPPKKKGGPLKLILILVIALLAVAGIAAAVIFVILPRLRPAPSEPSFADIPAGSYYVEPVAWAVDRGIVLGRDDGLFGPAQEITHGQMLLMMWRAVGSPMPENDPGVALTEADSAFFWAMSENLSFLAEAADRYLEICSRSEAAAYLWMAATRPELTLDMSFETCQEQAIDWAMDKKITSAKSVEEFRPADPCLRRDAVTMLYRARKNFK